MLKSIALKDEKKSESEMSSKFGLELRPFTRILVMSTERDGHASYRDDGYEVLDTRAGVVVYKGKSREDAASFADQLAKFYEKIDSSLCFEDHAQSVEMDSNLEKYFSVVRSEIKNRSSNEVLWSIYTLKCESGAVIVDFDLQYVMSVVASLGNGNLIKFKGTTFSAENRSSLKGSTP